MPAWPVNRGPTCATFKKPWATPHPPSPPTSIATSTQTNSTRSPPTSTDSTRPKRSVRRSPDKNRTKRTNDKVHKPCSYRSERWSRLGSNQRPSACEADALPLSHGTGAEGRTTSKTSMARTSQDAPRASRVLASLGLQLTKRFVWARSGGLSSSFAPGDDLARCARM
jgi:hypothetical protein